MIPQIKTANRPRQIRGKWSHSFERYCTSSASKRVSQVKEDDELPVFQVFKVSAQSCDSKLVTLKVSSGNFIRFEIDTRTS